MLNRGKDAERVRKCDYKYNERKDNADHRNGNGLNKMDEVIKHVIK